MAYRKVLKVEFDLELQFHRSKPSDVYRDIYCFACFQTVLLCFVERRKDTMRQLTESMQTSWHRLAQGNTHRLHGLPVKKIFYFEPISCCRSM
jgi:hypothetical protein